MANDPVYPHKKYWLGVCNGWFVTAALLLAVVVAFCPELQEEIYFTLPPLALPVLLWCAVCLGGAVVALCRGLERREERGFWWWQFWCFLAVLVCGLCLALMFLPAFQSSCRKNELFFCRRNMRAVWESLQIYAVDNEGFLPPENGTAGFNYLYRGGYLTDRACSRSPVYAGISDSPPAIKELECDYIFYGGGEFNTGEKRILLMDKPGNHRGKGDSVLYSDGTGEYVVREASDAK